VQEDLALWHVQSEGLHAAEDAEFEEEIKGLTAEEHLVKIVNMSMEAEKDCIELAKVRLCVRSYSSPCLCKMTVISMLQGAHAWYSNSVGCLCYDLFL
jgi:hypothetical protein